MREERLSQEMAKHQQELTPSRELWRGVAASIQQDPDAGKAATRSVGLLAAVVAGVLLLPLVWLMLPQQQKPDSHAELVALLNAHHQQQKSLLVASYDSSEVNYQMASYTEQTPVFATDLERLRAASIALTDALYKDPDNRGLLDMLRWVQAQELELMEIELQSQSKTRWQQL